MSNAHTRCYLHTFRQIGLKLIDLMALPLFIKAMPGKCINLKYMVKFLVKMIGKYSKCMLKKLSYHIYYHICNEITLWTEMVKMLKHYRWQAINVFSAVI